MTIAKGEGPDGTVFLLLGIGKENLKRLQEGKPIRLTRKTHGLGIPEKLIIGIMLGEQEDIMKQLHDADALAPEFQVFGY